MPDILNIFNFYFIFYLYLVFKKNCSENCFQQFDLIYYLIYIDFW